MFKTWIQHAEPPALQPVRLERRRIYILPTRQGYAFAALLFLLFLWAVNYSNSVGFAFTFLLAAVALNSIWQAHDNLLGLIVHPCNADAVFAGQDAQFRFRMVNPGKKTRHGVGLQWPNGQIQFFDVPAQSEVVVTVPMLAPQRGWLRPGRLQVLTRYPLGLLQPWSWITFDVACLVYPKPRGQQPFSATQTVRTGGAFSGQMLGGDDYAGLRAYVPGDSPRRIAWKSATRTDTNQLYVKCFTDPTDAELWLDWSHVSVENIEARLSQLCQWVLKAEREGRSYGLRLPGQIIAPARGHSHRSQCLETLALFKIQP